MSKLFPDYLEEGSEGPAVAALQLLLKGMEVDRGQIVVDSKYGPITTEAVRMLQIELFLTGENVDGKFGPRTRAKLKQYRGIDVDELEAEIFCGETISG